MGERHGMAQKGVRAIEAEKPQLEMAKALQERVFALPGLDPINVKPLLCDTLELADSRSSVHLRSATFLRFPLPRFLHSGAQSAGDSWA